MKTKKAPVTFATGAKIITCYTDGEKDHWGKAIWRDADGKAYELKYARRAGYYAFIPYSAYDKA